MNMERKLALNVHVLEGLGMSSVVGVVEMKWAEQQSRILTREAVWCLLHALET